jgi:RimJ/RimL family protein N-acetyltransferase
MLETDRLILTVGTLADATDMMKLNADPEVIRFVGESPLQNILEAEKIIRERILPQWEKYKMGRFSVRLKDGSYIGWCGLRYFPEYDEVDLGYRFMKRYWGQGFATESSRAVLKYGFETLNLKKIMAKAVPDNVNSIKVMQKLGMTYRGYRSGPGDPHPHVIYDMTKEEYQRCGIS